MIERAVEEMPEDTPAVPAAPPTMRLQQPVILVHGQVKGQGNYECFNTQPFSFDHCTACLVK